MHSFDRRKETHLYVCCGREDLRIDQPNCIEQRTKSFVNTTRFSMSQNMIADFVYVDLNQVPLCNFCQIITPLNPSHISCRMLRTVESLFFMPGCDSRSQDVVLLHNRILIFLNKKVFMTMINLYTYHLT